MTHGEKTSSNAPRSLVGFAVVVAFLLAPFVLTVVIAVASADDGQLSFRSVIEGLERRSFLWEPPSGGGSIEVHAFRVNPRTHRFRVVEAKPAKRDTVHAISRRKGLFLGVNASFFDEQGKPLGLMIDKGKKIQALRKVDWGVFQVFNDGKAAIVHTRDYEEDSRMDVAVQAGPRLVVDGKALKLKPQIARRTAVCVDARGAVILVVTEGGVFLQDLAALLARPEGVGGLGCKDALNLDGGPSTQGSFILGADRWDVYGGSAVPVVLGVQVRKEALP